MVLGRVSHQLLTLLQLTRMALVFTAISNGLAALLLRAQVHGVEPERLDPWLVGATLAVAIGLYGFGMALNDIIDRRRDRQIARGRPLPSGRIGVGAALLAAAILLALALAGGFVFLRRADAGLVSLLLVAFTAGLIVLYDYAGKYLVWLGLLMLGLIRFFHATVAAPQLTLAWHPLLLMNHVVIISAVAYRWEAKRPPLTPRQGWMLAGGLVALNVLLVAAFFFRRGESFADSLRLSPALIPPLLAAGGFAVFGYLIRRRANDRRAAGKSLILYGLLWLIAYDALFVGGYVDWRLGAGLLLLWPVAYLAVRAMRVWAVMTDLARKPEYIRAE
jgi:hypothetical protein